MHVLLRPNTVPMIARQCRLSIPHRAAFHAYPSRPRQAHRGPSEGRRPTSLPAEESNPAERFSSLDVLGSIPAPPSAVDVTYEDGFQMSSGIRVYGGVMLLNNEVFRWLPVPTGGPEESKAKTQGVLDLAEEAWGLLDVVYPKPELLILGTGSRTLMLSPQTRARISELGIRLDAMSTHSAAAQYNLLATERGGSQIAAAMLVDGFGK